MKDTTFLLAMDYEIENIFDLNDWTLELEKPFKIYAHRKLNTVRIVRTGIGKVNTAAATQFAVLRNSPKRIINLGVVGCINKKFDIGEVKQISECRFFDVDVTAFNYQFGQIPKCDIVNYKLKTTRKETAKVITGDSFVTDQSKFRDIVKLFSPDFIDMELGAIAHTLYINNELGILESYKAPSDYLDHSATKDFYENEKKAFANLRSLASNLLANLKLLLSYPSQRI